MITIDEAEAARMAAIRDSYSAIAADYGAPEVLEGRPHLLEHALFGVLAKRVAERGNAPLLDIGCGPGHQTAMLRDLGADAFGMDVAPGMLDFARRTHPDIRFEQGSLLDIPVSDTTLGGILACYSIIHVPRHLRPQVFAEFHRALAPGGVVMLVFQVGDDTRHGTEAFGKPVELHSYRQQPDEVADLLRESGFNIWIKTIRARESKELTEQGYLLAEKP